MKTKISITSIILILTINIMQAQIKILSDGSATIYGSSYTGGIRMGSQLFDKTGMILPCIYPAIPFGLTLGTQSNYIAGAYIYHMWSGIYDTWPSDKRLKNNIHKIDSAIQKIKRLNPVNYDVNTNIYDSVPVKMRDLIFQDNKNRLGFIAQEMQTVFPQSVHKEPISGYYGISTLDLIPVLVQAMKEQQDMIDDLQKKVYCNGKVKSMIITDTVPSKNIKIKVEKKDTKVVPVSPVKAENESPLLNNGEKELNASIEQNSPNPWNTITNIHYYLPKTNFITNAIIYIYDLQGLQKKAIKIIEAGNGNVSINSSELAAGMYYYTMVVDNKIIDTKRMLLTK